MGTTKCKPKEPEFGYWYMRGGAASTNLLLVRSDYEYRWKFEN